jgi:hypothetical protein
LLSDIPASLATFLPSTATLNTIGQAFAGFAVLVAVLFVPWWFSV